MTVPALAIKATDIFGSELAEARRLGFQLQLLADEPGIVAARLVPVTSRARAACRHQGEGVKAIQAHVALGEGEERLDALRDTIRKALELAREALA